eukprot:1941358-Amphidinium_carterae.1
MRTHAEQNDHQNFGHGHLTLLEAFGIHGRRHLIATSPTFAYSHDSHCRSFFRSVTHHGSMALKNHTGPWHDLKGNPPRTLCKRGIITSLSCHGAIEAMDTDLEVPCLFDRARVPLVQSGRASSK